MKKEDSAVFSGYEASTDEVQKVIKEWATVTEAFHHRYSKLNKVINSLQAASRQQSSPNRARLRKLTELRNQMSDVLMTLLIDMSGKKGRSLQPSQSGQLYSHVSLLNELNRIIDAELINFVTVAQA